MKTSEQQPPRRGAIYVRLSKTSDDETKIGDQESMGRRLASRENVAVEAVCLDDGRSAYRAGTRRDEFEKLVSLIESGCRRDCMCEWDARQECGCDWARMHPLAEDEHVDCSEPQLADVLDDGSNVCLRHTGVCEQCPLRHGCEVFEDPTRSL